MFCDGNSGWVTTTCAHPGGDRGVDEHEDLVAREVAGGEHEAVAGDDGEDPCGSGSSSPRVVDDRHRRAASMPGLAQLQLKRTHTGTLPSGGSRGRARRLVDRADGREPHDPRALARGDLDRQRVEAADGVVERDRPDERGRRARRG